MARILSEDCLSLARLIASGVPCSDIETDDGRDRDELLKAIAIELLLLDASHEEKSYVQTDIRRTHRNAYKSWSEPEERRVMNYLIAGHSIAEIAERMGRQPGGIISRIRKIRDREPRE